MVGISFNGVNLILKSAIDMCVCGVNYHLLQVYWLLYIHWPLASVVLKSNRAKFKVTQTNIYA